jgi:hypothetical protein
VDANTNTNVTGTLSACACVNLNDANLLHCRNQLPYD